MKPEAIKATIYDWFERRYPEGLQWTSSNFDCCRDAPAELRMILMMDKVEFEIANGGLPQLLWNVFFHWRLVLADSEAGYEMIGALAHSDAIRQFRMLFERHEQECRIYIERCISEGEFAHFNRWCDHGSSIMKSDREPLFYTNSGVQEQRLDWMARSEAKLAQLLSDTREHLH